MKTLLRTTAFIVAAVACLRAEAPSDVSALTEARFNELQRIDRDYKRTLDRLEAKYKKIGDHETVKLVRALKSGLRPARIAEPRDTHWNWKSGGELTLELDGDATHTEWERPGRWSLNQDGSIRLDGPTGIFRITFHNGTGHVIHLGKARVTTITPKD